MPLVVDHAGTRASLSSHARPATSLEPLTHTVSPAAPAGIVWGLATLAPSGVVDEGACEASPSASVGVTELTQPRTLASFGEDAPPEPGGVAEAPVVSSPEVPIERAAPKPDAPRRFRGVLGAPVKEGGPQADAPANPTGPAPEAPSRDEAEPDRAALWARWVEVALSSSAEVVRAQGRAGPAITPAPEGPRQRAHVPAPDGRGDVGPIVPGVAEHPKVVRAPRGPEARPPAGPEIVAAAPRAARPSSPGRPLEAPGNEVQPRPAQPEGGERIVPRMPEPAVGAPPIGPAELAIDVAGAQDSLQVPDTTHPALRSQPVDAALDVDAPRPSPGAKVARPQEAPTPAIPDRRARVEAEPSDAHEVLRPAEASRSSSAAQSPPSPLEPALRQAPARPSHVDRSVSSGPPALDRPLPHKGEPANDAQRPLIPSRRAHVEAEPPIPIARGHEGLPPAEGNRRLLPGQPAGIALCIDAQDVVRPVKADRATSPIPAIPSAAEVDPAEMPVRPVHVDPPVLTTRPVVRGSATQETRRPLIPDRPVDVSVHLVADPAPPPPGPAVLRAHDAAPSHDEPRPVIPGPPVEAHSNRTVSSLRPVEAERSVTRHTSAPPEKRDSTIPRAAIELRLPQADELRASAPVSATHGVDATPHCPGPPTSRPLVGDAAPLIPRRLAPDAVVETVPYDARRVAEAATGTDLGNTPVVRDGATAREAAGLGARAFARQGVVHLPRDLGPTGIEPARSLLVHELVHVAQQRAHGSNLPLESSREGRSLERAAVKVSVSAPPAAPPPALPPAARVEAGGSLVFGPSAPAPAPTPTPAPTPAPVQRAPVDEPAATNEKEEPEQLDLEDLARRLYPRIRPYLRKELSLDRERAGMTLGTRR